MIGPLWLERATAGDPPALAALEAECHSHPWTERQFREEVGYGPPGAVLVLRTGPSCGRRPWPRTPPPGDDRVPSGTPAPSGAAGGDLVAYAVYRVVVDEMHILNVAVAPAWRRRGLARWLLRFALDRAGRAGAIRALLEVREGNAEARALYADMGFVRLGLRRDYYREPVEDAVVLGLEPVP